MLACSALKDFCKVSLTLNDEIGKRRFQRYYRALGPLNGVGKFSAQIGIELVYFRIEDERSTN